VVGKRAYGAHISPTPWNHLSPLDHEEATLHQHNMRYVRQGGGGEGPEEEGDGQERHATTGKEDDWSCADVSRSKLKRNNNFWSRLRPSDLKSTV
jgi:hypothetical protein